MNAATLERAAELEITPLGGGRNRVMGPDGEHEVLVRPNKSTTCNCRAAAQYNQRCRHQVAVINYYAGFVQIEDDIEIPEPPEVADMERIPLLQYLTKLNKAHNKLTVKITEAYEDQKKAGKILRREKTKKKILELSKAELPMLKEAMFAVDAAADMKDDANVKYAIVRAKIEEVKSSTMRTQSALKDLRP